jgi:hypothetical protein
MSIVQDHGRTLGAIVSGWWRNWKQSRATFFQIEGLEGAELSRVARDVGVNSSELRTLAGKWPDSADLLSQRLAALQLTEDAVARFEPGVLHDLQRVCTLCDEKRRCGHDIDRDPSDPTWRRYCPNTETLDALEFERSARRLDYPSAK